MTGGMGRRQATCRSSTLRDLTCDSQERRRPLQRPERGRSAVDAYM